MISASPDLPSHPHAHQLSVWLMVAAASVFIMAVIGAITRLTESGLSMVEWTPLIGVLPPLDAAEWQRVFGLYQQTPEYRLKNFGMDMEAFKNIFFWEWLHRTFGHVIAVVYAVPLVIFTAQGKVPRAMLPRLLLIFALGGLQGGVGWYMVASGLVDRPDVSHFRLALHLGMAVLIYALTVWTVCDLRQRKEPTVFCIRRHGWVALLLVAITMLYGAFVAGLDAGFAYNTFPLMNGQWVPDEINTLQPWWQNALQNTAAVQWLHRWLAVAAAFAVLTYAWRLRGRRVAMWLGVAVLVQVMLGITALLLHVPVALGALHQAGALAVLTLLLICLHRHGKLKPA
ncbi:MAG: COX15/CtaA family protein [Bdellovibrionales bacterium]